MTTKEAKPPLNGITVHPEPTRGVVAFAASPLATWDMQPGQAEQFGLAIVAAAKAMKKLAAAEARRKAKPTAAKKATKKAK